LSGFFGRVVSLTVLSIIGPEQQFFKGNIGNGTAGGKEDFE
jgi:hypothetical protein